VQSRLRAIAISWCAIAPIIYFIDLMAPRLFDGTRTGRPFGDDFINYWSAAWLAFHGRAGEIYDWNAFHVFQTGIAGMPIDYYHYSYPPILLVLSAPLAALPYVPGLFAWLVSGWCAFYAALRVASPTQGLWLALATPAIFVNAVSGQNGTWTAALLGGGLTLLERRPILSGVLFGCLAYKPQMGLLLPLALAAGGYWRTIAAAAATVTALFAASVGLFGFRLWSGYLENIGVLRERILEDGTGVWHRMMSVFVAIRRIGADVASAYAIQCVMALLVTIVVVLLWRRRDCPAAIKYAALVLGTCLATPYLQDYDLVVGAFVAVWIYQAMPDRPRVALASAGGVLLLPLFGAGLASATGLALGPLVLMPAFAAVVWQAVRRLTPPAETVLRRRDFQMSKNTVSLSP